PAAPEGPARHGRGAGFAVAEGKPGDADAGFRPHRNARARRPQYPGAGAVAAAGGEHRVARHRSAAPLPRRGVSRVDNREQGEHRRETRRSGSAVVSVTSPVRPAPSTVQQWWTLTVRMITPT